MLVSVPRRAAAGLISLRVYLEAEVQKELKVHLEDGLTTLLNMHPKEARGRASRRLPVVFLCPQVCGYYQPAVEFSPRSTSILPCSTRLRCFPFFHLHFQTKTP